MHTQEAMEFVKGLAEKSHSTIPSTELERRFNATASQITGLCAHRFRERLKAYEALLLDGPTRCHGDQLSIADIALAGRLIGAARFNVDVTAFSRVEAIGASLMSLPDFASAHPDLQIDAP